MHATRTARTAQPAGAVDPDGTPAVRHRAARPDGGTRWDVQGLRAFAVTAVVLYHLWPNRLPGGFVGVDVFFVISGFLITGHLLRELEATGRIGLGAFWTRRARRLLPGAFTTIVVTGVAVLLVAPVSLWGQWGRELVAATVYVQNWQLAADAVDYLAQSNQASPFQHFWSLSVEEQFYIGLPLLLLGAVWVARRLRRAGARPVTVARVLLGAVAVTSFAWCVLETRTAPGVAYFSTATRAWEFALGGLVSTIPLGVPRTAVARTIRVVGAWSGVALLLAAQVVITPTVPFPGVAAALPVVGAGLVVLFGAHGALQPLGRVAPVAFTGRISYAVYLWHWPAVVLVPLATRHELTTLDKVAIAVGSFVLAAVTTLLVEEPLRGARWSRRLRPRRVALWGAVATVLVVSLGASTLTAAHVQQVQAARFADELANGDVRCFGAAAEIGSARPCVNPRLADVRVPAPAAAVQDDANRSACWSNDTPTFKVCTVGRATGYSEHLLAIGDSHNNVLVDAYERIAETHGWRIDIAGHLSCYFTTARQQDLTDARVATCDQWKQNAMAYVRSHPDLDGLLVTHSTGNSPVMVPAGSTNDATVVDGLVGAWRTATDLGIPVIALRDNPAAESDTLVCVSQMSGHTTGACDTPRSTALAQFDGSTQAAARLGPLAHVVDLTRYYCTATVCPAVIGGVVVHRDPTHLTNTFAKTLAPYYGAAIAAALRSRTG
ncbi:hypothetical protein Csp2054_03750 [Curtobacterium sp. 'Ferrero']|uniref:acyltransferase family protein n=1 Tax=Curtobacterium sp. 'Ferrero' TaxID=2033654 RepID=UPI000BC6DB28|nr:acyltransferase family protein [Curtobacterium sp. 'Ferrero']PCN49302.1 hypothetical protein Csp2054_03750 [Curtobacterium sp. 'Ferrero']